MPGESDPGVQYAYGHVPSDIAAPRRLFPRNPPQHPSHCRMKPEAVQPVDRGGVTATPIGCIARSRFYVRRISTYSYQARLDFDYPRELTFPSEKMRRYRCRVRGSPGHPQGTQRMQRIDVTRVVAEWSGGNV